ncbi:MAG: prephenate dehydrogenase/arogenate dehydrogenase family protein [Akkermansia sp.]
MPTAFPFHHVAILGPGLLGGSVAHSLRQAAPKCEIRLWARREQPLELARELKLADICSTELEPVVKGADLVILATPICAFQPLSEGMIPFLNRQAIVTDVGSVKHYVHRTTGQYLADHNRIFIGSHPMAGAEKQGLEYANAQLLTGATVAICNEQDVADEYLCKLESFWQQLGGITHRMGAKHHDQSVARISHLPHVLAALCARGAEDKKIPMDDLQALSASGFRDTTRVATGSPSMWADILWENDVAVRDALHFCLKDLQHLIEMLEGQDKTATEAWLAEAKATRERIYQK